MTHFLLSTLLALWIQVDSTACTITSTPQLSISNSSQEWTYQQGDFIKLTWADENGIGETSVKGNLEEVEEDAIMVSGTWIPVSQISRISMPRRNQKPMTQSVNHRLTALIFGLPLVAVGLFLVVLISAFGGPSNRFEELLANGGAIFSYLLFLFGPVLGIIFHPGRKRKLGKKWSLRIK